METLILIYALSFAFTLGLNSNMETGLNVQASWLEKIVCSIFHAVFIPFVLAYAFGKWASRENNNE